MILVATDLSDESLAAARWAAAYSDEANEELTAVYVVENEFHELPGSPPLLSDAGVERKLRKAVETRMAAELPDRSIAVELREGRPQSEIEAAARGASLLVLGKASDSVSRLILGSVPERICHDPALPVVVVNPDRPLTGSPRWVVGVDFSSHSTTTLGIAARMARVTGAHLHIVHILPVPSPTVVSDASIMQIELDSLPMTEARKWSKEQMEAFIERNEALLAGLSYEFDVIEGYPVISLIETATSHDADAIVVGTAGRSSMGDRIMGSVAFGVVKRMPTTVILAPSFAAS